MSGELLVRIADISFGIRHRYPYIRTLCRDYTAEDVSPDFWLEAGDEDILAERALAPEGVSEDYLEATCIHRLLAEELYRYDAFLLHSAVISYQGEGYAFAAHSGVGKSTHIGLWRRRFGDAVSVVNGDKPIIRLVDRDFYAYGTPYRGKEGFGSNTKCRLKRLCFLERGEQNEITAAPDDMILTRFFGQVYMPTTADAAGKTLELIDRFVTETSFYHLKCNMDISAAEVSFDGMNS